MEKIAKQLVWNVLFEKAVSYDEKEQYISNYRNEFPEDVDVYAMEIELLVQGNKLEDAYNIAKVALRRNPYLIIVHFNLAKICEMQSKYLEAYRHYSITKFLAGYAEEKDIVPICEKSMQTVLKHLEVKRSQKELETVGLIMRVRQGIGEPKWIYVLIPGKEDAALA